MSVPIKKEIEVLWQGEVDGVSSRLAKLPYDITVVQQLRNDVWSTKGIYDKELQDIWKAIRADPSDNG